MRYLAALIAGIVFLLGSCGTTRPYTGPEGKDPVVEVEVFRHVDSVTDPRNPHWTRNTIVDVSNPSRQPMDVVLSCDAKDETKGLGTYSHLTIPARTTQQVLLGSDDVVCLVSRE